MLPYLFKLDILSIIHITLVVFLSIIIHSFAKRYMEGDKNYKKFSLHLFVISLSLIALGVSDNIIIFLVHWSLINWNLVKLMTHKKEWKAAYFSGKLASRYFIFSTFLLALSFFLMYMETHSTSIQTIIYYSSWNPTSFFISFEGIFIAAMIQSGIWPFHKWLISSANSPTPVSALMHAGIINGGGFLLIRFAPLYSSNSWILNLIFLVGLFTAITGNLWKLIQSDNKGMLTCSTMGQMGFMVMQCGLGLFSAALAHICWHGLFKSYLFLSSGSAAQEKREAASKSYKKREIFISIILGILGCYTAIFTSGKSIIALDSNLFLLGIFFIAASQSSLSLIKSFNGIVLPGLFNIFGAFCYGKSVNLIHDLIAPLYLDSPQSLNIFHILGFMIFIITWIILTFDFPQSLASQKYLRFYVKMLNAMQSSPQTVTSHHNNYKY